MTCYGVCDYCTVFLKKDDECIMIKDLHGKFLNIEFCSEDCCNKSKIEYPFLNKYTIENKNCTEPATPDINLISYFVVNFPSYMFKDYDDFINGKVEKPTYYNSIQLLESINILSSKKQISDKDADFLNACVSKNIV